MNEKKKMQHKKKKRRQTIKIHIGEANLFQLQGAVRGKEITQWGRGASWRFFQCILYGTLNIRCESK